MSKDTIQGCLVLLGLFLLSWALLLGAVYLLVKFLKLLVGLYD